MTMRRSGTGITDFHGKYFAHELTRPGRHGVDRLSQSLFDASVDLNPHQVEAALFAMRSPLSKGALLADEVGLGKTIEAGLVLCQYWAERKRRLLVVCPASLRKQWQIELEDKFNLPALVLDSRVYRKAVKDGAGNPLESQAVIITSLHYAARLANEMRLVPWDLVVIDEAHKLRNSHRASNRIGQAIRWALEDRQKLLLTATPLQNSLTELYGITTLIDDQLFGDLPTFRTLYATVDGDLRDLQARLAGFCKRTLRRDVQEFIRYTERKLTTIKFSPTDDEHKLYEAVSAFLQREDSYAFPKRQRHLTIIVVRKVLASSPVALASTLEVIRDRLISMRDQARDTSDITDRLLDEDDLDEELLEELLEELEAGDESEGDRDQEDEQVIDRAKLEAEIEEVERYIRWARSLGIDTKTRHLLRALEIGYESLAEMGAAEKAVVFTESRKTQAYLKSFLEANGYAGQVITFSGTNTDPDCARVYEQWLAANQDTGKLSGSRAIDIRHAIIDHFQNEAKVMIATEAAGEGINLQFCSLMVNFDLPWNPQRIEQRIGRVHRYGQKHDVVVINFLNERNAADQRVYELLRHKFHLFEGVFGASDEVLGQLDSSAGLERRILDLYQQCRTTAEIEEGFRQLQQELDEQIQLKMADTRRILLEHFDEDVHAHIRINYDATLRALDAVGRKFWRLTRHILDGMAEFDEHALCFQLRQAPGLDIHTGTYVLNRKRDVRGQDAAGQRDDEDGWNLYRLNHPLGEYCIAQGKALATDPAHVEFDLTGYDARLSALEPYQGRSGWLVLNRLVVESLDREEYLLFSGFTDDGKSLDHDVIDQFFRLDGRVRGDAAPGKSREKHLLADAGQFAQATLRRSLEENNRHFQERREQLYRWAEDVVRAAERDLDLAKAEVRAANRAASLAATVEEQKRAQEHVREMERKKRRARQRIFEVEDDIEAKRDALIEALEKKMVQNTETQPLFMLRWTIV
jgi:SNF2 family DNA or RNA helicase